MNILYVHGYNSGKDSLGSQLIKKQLNKLGIECNLIAPAFSNNIGDIGGNVLNISKLIKNENIDIIISASFGCFQTLLADNDSQMGVFVNPCLFPSIEIAMIAHLSNEDISLLKQLETEILNDTTVFNDTQHFFLSKNDELFGSENVNKHIELLKRKISANNIQLYDSNKHSMPKQMLLDVCKSISDYLDDLAVDESIGNRF